MPRQPLQKRVFFSGNSIIIGSLDGVKPGIGLGLYLSYALYNDIPGKKGIELNDHVFVLERLIQIAMEELLLAMNTGVGPATGYDLDLLPEYL